MYGWLLFIDLEYLLPWIGNHGFQLTCNWPWWHDTVYHDHRYWQFPLICWPEIWKSLLFTGTTCAANIIHKLSCLSWHFYAYQRWICDAICSWFYLSKRQILTSWIIATWVETPRPIHANTLTSQWRGTVLAQIIFRTVSAVVLISCYVLCGSFFISIPYHPCN